WVQQALRREELSPVNQMRELAYVCFVPAMNRRISGNWDNLSPELRESVRSAFVRGFEEGEPTPLPYGRGSFPGSLLAEGRAFIDLLKHDSAFPWLTGELICQW